MAPLWTIAQLGRLSEQLVPDPTPKASRVLREMCAALAAGDAARSLELAAELSGVVNG